MNPINLFSASGVNVLTAKHQDEEIDRLKAENERLRRLLRRAAKRIAEGKPEASAEIHGALH